MSQTIVGNLAVELGMSTEEFQRALAHAQVQAQAAANKIQAKINQAGSSAASGSMSGAARSADGILQLSRAIDDAQYGLRGVINNVEGIARGFGFGTGVAAMATIAAVSIGAIAPAVAKGTEEASKFFGYWKSESESVRTSVTGMMSGFGGNAFASALKSQAEFLMNRTDEVGGFNIDFIQRALGMGSIDENAMANNMRRSIEASALMAQSFRAAADASKALAAAQRGASAQYDLTTNQAALVGTNRQVFQAAVDRFGGGDNLRTKLTSEARRGGMMKSDAEQLYGRFANGEIEATRKVVDLLGLQSEQRKIMADEFERSTGAAEELRRIEEDREKIAKQTAKFIEDEARWFDNAARADERMSLADAGRDFDSQIREFESASKRQESLMKQRDSMIYNMSRSEIVGASDVFSRNLNAGIEDPQLKELKEIKEEIKNLGSVTGILN